MFNKLPYQFLHNNESPIIINTNYISHITGLLFREVPVMRAYYSSKSKCFGLLDLLLTVKLPVILNLLVLVVMVDDRCGKYGRLLKQIRPRRSRTGAPKAVSTWSNSDGSRCVDPVGRPRVCTRTGSRIPVSGTAKTWSRRMRLRWDGASVYSSSTIFNAVWIATGEGTTVTSFNIGGRTSHRCWSKSLTDSGTTRWRNAWAQG